MSSLTGNRGNDDREGYVDRQEVIDAKYYIFDINRILFQKRVQLTGKEKWMKIDYDPVARAQDLCDRMITLNLGKDKECADIIDVIQRIQVEDFNGVEKSIELGFTKVTTEEIENTQTILLDLLQLLNKVPQIYDSTQVTHY